MSTMLPLQLALISGGSILIGIMLGSGVYKQCPMLLAGNVSCAILSITNALRASKQ